MKKVLSIFKDYYYYLYIFLLVTAVVSIPYSRALLSCAQISLASLWILSGDFKKKYFRFKENKVILLILIIFFLHILGLIHTTDFHTAFKDIKIKLPLLLFPVVIGTSDKLRMKELKLILIAFSVSLILNAIWGMFGFLNITNNEVIDIQGISGKLSHIRFSLMLNIAAFSMIWFSINESGKHKKIKIGLYILLASLSILFIILIQSVTGWVVFATLSVVSFLYFIFLSKRKELKISSLILMILIIAGSSSYIVYAYKKFSSTQDINFSHLDSHTIYGHKYSNDTLSNAKENEYFVNIYISEEELKKAWNSKSKFSYNGKDKKGQRIKYTLIRYMTSKGLRKDKQGIEQLSESDIKNIENGLTNYIFENQLAIYPKLYELFWQIQQYRRGGNPEGHSVTQRIEFFKIGIEISKQNFWFGTGTGDVKAAFKKQYKISDSKLSEKYRLRSHNQYLTVFISFGFIGFLIFSFSYFYLPFITKKYKDYLFLITYVLVSISMLNEDTLQTQMGVTLFALFLNMFIFSDTEREKIDCC